MTCAPAYGLGKSNYWLTRSHSTVTSYSLVKAMSLLLFSYYDVIRRYQEQNNAKAKGLWDDKARQGELKKIIHWFSLQNHEAVGYWRQAILVPKYDLVGFDCAYNCSPCTNFLDWHNR